MKSVKSFYKISILTISLLFVLSANALCGGFGDNITINGFGHQSYIKTDTNTYVVGDATQGSFKDYVMGLTFSAKVTNQVFIRAQMVHSSDGFQLDWGFGEYHFNDNFGVKAGKVKLPFGLYSETVDVKALQPFGYLHGVYFYGINDFNGVSLFSSFESESGFGGSLDIYGGTGIYAVGFAQGSLEDFYGGQAWITLPVDGLRFGYGYWQTVLNVTNYPEIDVNMHMGSGEYIGNKFFAKTEYNKVQAQGENTQTNFYMEAGYQVHEMIQPVMRYGWQKLHEDKMVLDYRGLTETETEYAFGVNIFPSRGFMVKLEHHVMDGSASLDRTQMMAQNLAPNDKWSLTMMSVAFMF
jgi:hypothetical protein